MKKVITMLVLGVTILSTVMLGGCGKSDPTISKSETPYSVVEKLSADGQYKVINYLTEQSNDVAKIKETVEGYVKAYTTADYKTTDGMGTYGYYDETILQEFKKKNDATESVKFYKDNALVTEFDSYKIDSIKITKDMNLAEIKGSLVYKYTEGTEEFFKQYDKQKGASYKQDFTLQLTKQNDVWKISFRKITAATPASK
jgi:major membrane immunogen (membrane-anchored lipoprotein)